MLSVALPLAVLIGAVLGLVGGGGSILMLPLLVCLLHTEPKSAIASTLLIVGATSLVGAVAHARRGGVRFRAGVLLGAAAMLGAFAGGRLAAYVPSDALMVGFALVMTATGLAMFRRRAEVVAAIAAGRLLGAGLAIGLVSGLVGAGGGFLVVPALVFCGGLATREAVGTSLFVIALQSTAGLLGHLGHTHIDMRLTGLLALAAVIGTLFGVKVAPAVPVAGLRRGFAVLVLAVASLMLFSHLL